MLFLYLINKFIVTVNYINDSFYFIIIFCYFSNFIMIKIKKSTKDNLIENYNELNTKETFRQLLKSSNLVNFKN